MPRKNNIASILLLVLFVFVKIDICFSQNQLVDVEGKFLSDSIRIGSIFSYALSVRYPQNLNIVFPDSAYHFGEYEFYEKQFFPTQSKEGISTDSAIYHLISFEIDSVQKLQLPIFLIHKNDCTAVYPATDSVFLQFVVKQIPDKLAAHQLPLKINTSYFGVQLPPDYVLLIFIITIVIISLCIVWFIFRKRIYNYFKMRTLNRNHATFDHHFHDILQRLRLRESITDVEFIVSLWKKYMEQLTEKSFTKYTTKEMHQIFNDSSLYTSLQIIDKTIYGKTYACEEKAFIKLKDYADRCFEHKIIDLKNG